MLSGDPGNLSTQCGPRPLKLSARSSGSEGAPDGEQKEWTPFSGVGRRLCDSSGETLPSPKARRRGDASSPTGASPSSSADISPGTFINLDQEEAPEADAEDGDSKLFMEWARLEPMPPPAAWKQPRDWILADFVGASVGSSVFGAGDIGQQLIPEESLVKFGAPIPKECFDDLEEAPSMLAFLKGCSLAVLSRALVLLGQEEPDDLAIAATEALLAGCITPLQHKYFSFISTRAES